MTALAYSARAGAVDFSLVSEQAFPAGSTPTVRVSGRGLGVLRFRLYRIEDPEAFFQAPPPLGHDEELAGSTAAVRAEGEDAGPEKAPDGVLRAAAEDAKGRLPAELRRGLRSWLGVGWVPPFTPGRRPGGLRPLASLPLVSAWSRDLSGSYGGWTYQSLPVPVPGRGLYLLEAVQGRDVAQTLILSTGLSFEVKRSSGAAFVFCADAVDGRPVRGARVLSLEPVPAGLPRGRLIDAGLTGPDGTWRGRASPEGLFIARRGEDVAAALARESWSREPAWKLYLYADRPVYRPGQTVFFKGVVRRVEEGRYLPGSAEVAVEIKDPKGGVVFKSTAAPGAYGTFEGRSELPADVPLGSFTLSASAGGVAQAAAFEVQEYRKPEFRVAVESPAGRVVLGDTLIFRVRADYFFGSPVAGAPVEYTLYRVPRWSWSAWNPEEDGEEGSSFEYGGGAVETGTSRLDENGRLALTFTAKADGDARPWGPREFLYRLAANVTDAGRRTVSGEGAVLATRADWYLSLKNDRFIYAAGEPFQVGVRAETYEHSPVETEVEARATYLEEGRPSAAADLRTFLPLTRAGGVWPLRLDKPGAWRLDVKGLDAAGRPVEASEVVWAAGPGASGPRPRRLALLPDRKSYRPGQTARLLVMSPVKAPVLLTVEGPKVLLARVLPASEGPSLAALPVPESWSPDVYVTASVLAGGEAYKAGRRLLVSPDSRLLKMTVRADRAQAGPDEDVTITVTARDGRGRPADAEVSVGVVDEAVYSLVPELAPPIQDAFYGPRPNRTTTAFSRSFWVRGSSRKEAVPEAGPDDDFEADDVKAGPEAPRVRRRFEDTMAWVAMLPTGPAGTAVFRAHTPDNLTTWRMTTRGVTADTRVGQSTGTFVVRKDLLVRLELPRFYVKGDEGVVTAVLDNTTGKAMTARADLELEGGALAAERAAPAVLKLGPRGQARAEWTVRAVKGGLAKVRVRAAAPAASDGVELAVPVREHGLARAASSALEVPASSPSAASVLELPSTADPESASLVVTVTPSPAAALVEALPGLMEYPYGCVEQTMSRFGPTLAAARAFRELNLPSERLPKDVDKMVAAGVKRLLGFQHADGGWGWWKDDETHPFMSAYALWGLLQAREQGYPVDDGAVRRGLDSVVGQLSASASAGKDEDSGSRYGAGSGGPTIRAFMLYVLSQAVEAAPAAAPLAQKLLAESPRMNDQSKALLALSLARLGSESAGAGLVVQLESAAERTSGAARWKGKGFDHGWYDDTDQTTAAVLRSLVRLKPSSPLAPEALKALLLDRRGPLWRSTPDTAAAAYALVDYMKAAPRASAEQEVRIVVNGREAARRRLARGAGDVKLVLGAAGLREGANRIEVLRDGTGVLYASASLEYYERGEDLKPLDGTRFKLRRTFERLEAAALPDGTPGYVRSGLKGLRSGDAVLVTLELDASSGAEFFQLESPHPSGFEATDALDRARIEGLDGDWKGDAADSLERRDDRLALFRTRLPAGRSVWRYVLRAEAPGRFHALPAAAELTYEPEVRASSEETRLDVGR